MSLHILDKDIRFPDVSASLEDGLLAIGGDLSTERLLLAYRSGIFPWFNNDELPMWWCPDPRFVLLPADLKISKSMQQELNRGRFEFRFNTEFEQVIRNCQSIQRKGQEGTWITEEIISAYFRLYQLGLACCAETWMNGQLAGGLYGVRMGRVFFGESMFSLQTNASKFAFIRYVQQLQQESVAIIDCQVYTQHLESLGAHMISRRRFLELIKQYI